MTLYSIRRWLSRLTATIALCACHSAWSESLLDIYEMAIENDAQLRAQEAQFLANMERENIARSALLPQVTAGYGITDNLTETTSQQILGFGSDGAPLIGEGFNRNDTRTNGWDVSLSQTLFDLSAWYNWQAGEEFSKQAEAEFAANTQNLIVRVAEAYFNVLRAQDNLSAAQAQERALERQLEQTQQRFEVGLIAITDVYEAESARDLAQVTRIEAENSVDVAMENLSVLTGKRHGTLRTLDSSFKAEPPTPGDRASWVDFALENNFNLAAARYAEESARQTAKAQKFEHAPKVTASYQYSDTDTDGSRDADPRPIFLVQPDSQQTQEVLRLRVDVPLFTGGRISAQRRQSAQQYLAAKETRINLQRTTITNARSLHMTVMFNAARVQARRQAIKSTQSALDATEAGYEVGTRNIVDVLNARNALFAAQRDYANSRYDYVLNSLRLKENAGTLTPDDIARLNSFLTDAKAPTASTAR